MLLHIDKIVFGCWDLSQKLDKWMAIKAFNWLIMAKNVETSHRTSEYAFSSNMDLTETEKLVLCQSFMYAGVIAYNLIKMVGVA